ncbi:MAG: hypothetical protein AAB227_12715 [Pseudomonadota bacterium]
MSFGIIFMRAALAFVAALFVATASVVAPVSELTEEMHHAAAHADDDASSAMQVANAPDSGAPQHQHPDTPGHSHCGAACHIQLSDARSALAVVYSASRALFVAFDDHYKPASHLDGLFRPPRA